MFNPVFFDNLNLLLFSDDPEQISFFIEPTPEFTPLEKPSIPLFADIFGTEGDDILVAMVFDVVYGLGGNDSITGSVSADEATAHGGDGNDFIHLAGALSTANGDAGNDHIVLSDYGSGFGGDGDDIFDVFLNFTGATVDGGTGYDVLNANTDLLDFDNQYGGTINLQTNVTAGDYAGLVISNLEAITINGGGFSDNITGGDGDDHIGDGGAFFSVTDLLHTADTLYGMGGNDFI